VVEVEFKKEKEVQAFEEEWRVLADYCRTHEPNTISYQMAR